MELISASLTGGAVTASVRLSDVTCALETVSVTVGVYNENKLLGVKTATLANPRAALNKDFEITGGFLDATHVSAFAWQSAAAMLPLCAADTRLVSYNIDDLGTLTGKVARAGDEAQGISGASIVIKTAQGSPMGSCSTDSNGVFSVVLPAGDFILTVSAQGYKTIRARQEVAAQSETYAEVYLAVEDIDADAAVTGYITNAFTGNIISSVELLFREGYNMTEGDIVATAQTNSSGVYSVTLPYGNYTVQAGKDGYITNYFNVTSYGNSPSKQQNASLTPVLAEGETRIVLTWGATPSDLDSHLVGPRVSGGNFHVFYSNKSETVSGVRYADLDVDDTSSYGPETTTIYAQQEGVYRFFVHDYTNRNLSSSTAMSNSGASVKVYRGEAHIATYNVPINQGGTLWTVFELNGSELIPVNTMSYHTNAQTVGASGQAAFAMMQMSDSPDKE